MKGFEGKKIRGADNEPNFVLVEDAIYICSAEIVSFEFINCQNTPNIIYIGYSKALKQLFIHMGNGKRYIYHTVPVEKWQCRHNYTEMNVYHNMEIKGIGYFETTEWLKPATSQYVLDYLEKLVYYRTITEGLWATDQPDKVIDTNDLLFQLQF